MAKLKDVFLDLGVAARTLPGQTESGDLHLVQPCAGGVMIAVVDGLGHGMEAAAAARAAVAVLRGHAQESLPPLVQRCHARLRETRGVVLSIARVNTLDETMTWLGVGNVEGKLLRADPRAMPQYESLLPQGGVVGGQLPRLHAAVVSVARGDTLVLVTDGIDPEFLREVTPSSRPQQMADRILERHFTGRDDALVLAARYGGVTA